MNPAFVQIHRRTKDGKENVGTEDSSAGTPVLQLATNVWGKSPYTDNLSGDPFGTFAKSMTTHEYEGFNGSVEANLALGVRAFKDILSISKSSADAAGLYRAGSRTGFGYSDRFSQYQTEWKADKAYLDCLRVQK